MKITARTRYNFFDFMVNPDVPYYNTVVFFFVKFKIILQFQNENDEQEHVRSSTSTY